MSDTAWNHAHIVEPAEEANQIVAHVDYFLGVLETSDMSAELKLDAAKNMLLSIQNMAKRADAWMLQLEDAVEEAENSKNYTIHHIIEYKES